MPKASKPKHRYVVEVLVETDVKVTKKCIREATEIAMWHLDYQPDPGHGWRSARTRVRKVDLD